jgi:YidC/Oxa1 family membrane protein insertase
MDRIQIAAIALAVALMALFFVMQPKAPPSEPRLEPPSAESLPSTEDLMTQAAPGNDATFDATSQDASEDQLSNDAVRVRVSNQGGRLTSVELLRFADRVGQAAQPVQLVTLPTRGTAIAAVGAEDLPSLNDALYERVALEGLRVDYRYRQDGVEVRRSVELDPSGYGAWLRVGIMNRTPRTIRPGFELRLYGQERPADAPDRFQNYSLVALSGDDIERKALSGIESPGFLSGLFGSNGELGVELPGPVHWVAIDDQYFLLAAIPEDAARVSAFEGPIGRDAGIALLRHAPSEIPSGHQLERSYRLYLGPKVSSAVEQVDPRLAPALEVGWRWVQPLVRLFEVMLVWIHDHVVANFGVAIILLTVLLRLVTFPLAQQSMKSMRRMGELGPELKELQARYSDDRTKLQAEMMALYRRKGVNPLTAMGGGCVPMLIQMPFLLALYFALQASIELRHAPFAFWIDDLSAPENFLSIAGIPIRPLPLLMGAAMLAQMWLTPSTTDAQQKQMMMWMNVVFVFMFYQFPSGLVLYWLVSTLLGSLQQLLVNREPLRAAAT